MAVVSDVTVRLRVDVSDLQRGLKAISDSSSTKGLQDGLGGVDSQLQKIGKNQSMNILGNALSEVGAMSGQLADGVKDLGADAFTSFVEFERGLSKVSAMGGVTGDSLKQLEKTAIDLGGSTEFTSREVVSAFQSMALAGWKQKDMLDGVGGALDLATISGLDFGQVTGYLINALTPFNMTAKDSAKVVDILAKTATSANFNVNDMAKSFEYVAPIAGAMGYKVEEVSIALGLLANNGLKGSKAGTALRKMLTDLNSPTSEASDVMSELNIQLSNADGSMRPLIDVLKETSIKFQGLTDVQKAQYAETLTGKTGMAGFLAIMNGGPEKIDAMTASVMDFDGAGAKMAGTIRNDTMGSLDELSSSWDNFQIGIGTVLADALMPLITGLTNVTRWLGNMDEGTKKIVVAVGLFTAGLFSLIAVAGALVPVFIALSVASALITVPMTTIALVIVGIIAGIALLIVYWDDLVAGMAVGWEYIKTKAVEACQWITTEWNGFVEWFKSVPDKISQWWSDGIEYLKTKWAEFVQFCKDRGNEFIEWMKSLPMKFAEWMNGVLKAGIAGFEAMVNGFVYWFNYFFSEYLPSLPAKFAEWLENLKKWANTKIGEMITAMQNEFNGWIAWCKSLPQKWSDAVDALKAKAKAMGEAIKKHLSDEIDGFIAWCRSLPQKFEDAVKDIKNRARAIGNGVAEDFMSGVKWLRDRVRSFFTTMFDGVHFKTPHFTFSGSMNPLKWADEGVPKIGVDWYAKGGIFSGAQVIGVGESGDEAVVPLSNRTKVKPFAQAVAQEMGGGAGGGLTINVGELVVREEADIRKVAQELYRLQQYKSRGKGF